MSQLKLKPLRTQTEARLRLQELGDPTIREHIKQLRRAMAKLGGRPARLRRIVDQAMDTSC